MQTATIIKATIAKFRDGVVAAKNHPDRGAPNFGFWLQLLWQTFTERKLARLSELVLDNYRVVGLEHIPPTGPFTVAVNHSMQRWLPRLLAAVHAASLQKRPELANEWLVIVGFREANLAGRNRIIRWLVPKTRKLYFKVYSRWQHNILRLPMGNDRASIQALRHWKQRAQNQPTIVFPEGRGAQTFEGVRPGAGRWLANLGVPVLPISVWWETDKQRWQVVFGPPISWSTQTDLHDLQIGLEIALGLPPDQAPNWQEALLRWQKAYESEVDADTAVI